MALSLDPLLMPQKAASWGGLNQMEELSRVNMKPGMWDPKLRQLSPVSRGTAGVYWEGGRGTKNLGKPKWTQKSDGVVGNSCSLQGLGGSWRC